MEEIKEAPRNWFRNTLFTQTLRKIALADNILLASPVKPDADSCASMVAMRAFIYSLFLNDQKVTLWAPEKPEPNSMFQRIKPLGDPMTEITTEFPEKIPDLVIAFDYGQFWRLKLDHLIGKTFFIGFDHHKPRGKGSEFPHDGVNGFEICNPEMPSATALLYRFFEFKELLSGKKIIQPELADCLLVGLMADTSKLTNKLTTPEALEIARELWLLGANYHGVLESMRFETSAAAFKAQMYARDQIVIVPDCGLAFLSFSQEDLRKWGDIRFQVSIRDILPLHGQLQNIEGIRVAAAYFEQPDGTWYCSLRNRSGKGVDVGEIARRLGKDGKGGGHDYAAGFQSDKTPAEVFQILQNEIKKQGG